MLASIGARIGAGVLLLAGAFGAGWQVANWRTDARELRSVEAARLAERAAWSKSVARATADQAAAEARSGALAVEVQQYREATDLLAAAVARGPLTQYREVPVREGETSVRVPVRGARFRLCWNAAVTGSPADRAACEASDVHGDPAAAAVPATDVVRPRAP